MKNQYLSIATTIGLLTFFISCGGSSSSSNGKSFVKITLGGSGKPDINSNQGTGFRANSIPSNIHKFSFTISASDMATINKDVLVSGQTTVTETFSIQNGSSRYFLIEAKDNSGTVLYKGDTTKDLNGTPVTLNIIMVAQNTTSGGTTTTTDTTTTTTTTTTTITTTTTSDTTAPTITAASPGDGATGVSLTSTITVSFSESMDSSTINTSTFTLSGVSGTVTYSGTTATFTPSSSLSYSTTYTATISTGVKDSAGNAMASSYTWSFLTVSATYFSDTFESGLGNWTTGGTYSIYGPWGRTTSSAHNGSYSVSDSPNISTYEDDSDSTLTLTNSINLSSSTTPELRFWHTYDTEDSYDYGNVEVSTDGGSTWTTIKSFTGSSTTWSQVKLSLMFYKSSSVKVRFRFYSDGSISNYAGWFIDDVEIVDTLGAAGWKLSGIDSAYDVGQWSSTAIDSNNKIHISYLDTVQGLKYATNATGSLVTSIIDNSLGMGYYTSIAVDSNNKIHVSYYNSATKDLKYATNASGSWVTSTIDSAGFVGEFTSLAVDSNDKMHISYRDATNSDLKYATNASGSWVTSTIDNAGQVGLYSDIAVAPNGKLHISYYDLIGDLMYATDGP